MMKSQVAMVLCILGWTFLLSFPDSTTASDKFFLTGGRFGKRHEERFSDNHYSAGMLKTRSVDNVPPRIERGFYISRYGKRNTNSITDNEYFTLCMASFGMYCDYTGLSNQYLCKRIHPMDCSNLNHVDEKKPQLKSENDQFVNNY